MSRPLDAQTTEVAETDFDRAVDPIHRQIQIDAQAGERRLIDDRGGAGCQHRQALLRRGQCASQKLTFRSVQLQREYEVRPLLPCVVWHSRSARNKIAQCRSIGRGSFGASTCDQIEIHKLLLFVSRRDQSSTAIKLIDDLENRLFPLLRRSVSDQQPTDSEMRLGAPCLRDQGIGRFLNAVVDKLIRTLQKHNKLKTQSLPQIRVELIFRCPVNDRKRGDLGTVSETSKLF